MTIRRSVRTFTLVAHVTTSVGWLGAVVVFVGLSVLGMTSRDAATVRGVYLVMEPAGWSVLVPLALVSLLTGLVLSLGTTWGLFRHYWVVFKLLINVVAGTVLLLYMQTLGFLADLAAATTTAAADVSTLRTPSPVIHAAGALLLLLVAAALSVYKPRGLTRYGQRKQRDLSQRPSTFPTRSRGRALTAGAISGSDPRPGPAWWRRRQIE